MRTFQWILLAALILVQPIVQAGSAEAQSETFQGQLEIIRADNFVTGVSSTRFFLKLQPTKGSDPAVLLTFPDGLPNTPLRTGDTVTVQGQLTGGEIQVQSLQLPAPQNTYGSAGVSQSIPIVAAAIEDRRAAIIIVSMLDSVNSLSMSDVAGFMYSDPQNVDGLYEASSFQQLGFNPDTDGDTDPDVFGPYTINHNAKTGCDYSTWAAAADAAAQADGVDLSLYQHKVYILPSDAACGWSGLGSVGCSENFCNVWVKEGDGPVLAHELGHNLGWYHAGTDPENDGTINSEYGDRSGIMGWPYWSQANAPHRDQYQWFDAFPGTLQSVQTSGTHELYALELDPGVDTVQTQVVRLPKNGTSEYYYLSYRREIGDYPVYSSYADKINIHRNASAGYNSVHITNLDQGETFTDSSNNIITTITATATGDATATVTVTINHLPTPSFSSSADGLSVQFTDSSSDSDGSIQSRSWDFGDGQLSTDTHPAHTYADYGTYTVTLTVADAQSGSATATNAVSIQPSVSQIDSGSGGGGSSGGCFIRGLLKQN